MRNGLTHGLVLSFLIVSYRTPTLHADEDGVPGTAIWVQQIGVNSLNAHACTDGEHVFVSGPQDILRRARFRALTIKDGLERWQFTSDGSCVGPPLIDKGLLYFGTSSGAFYCLDATKGKPVWEIKLEGPQVGAPSLINNELYTISENAGNSRRVIAKHDARTGRAKWTHETPAHIQGAATVGRGRLYIPTWGIGTDSGVLCVDAATGKQRWLFRTGDTVSHSPCLVGGRIYFGCRNRTGYAIDAARGKELWKFASLATLDTPVVHQDGRVYYISGHPERAIYSMDARSGEKQWSLELPTDATQFHPIVSGNTLYLGASIAAGYVFAIDLKDHAILWQYGRGLSLNSPCISKGRLVVTAANKVHCIWTGKGDSPDWLQFGGDTTRMGSNLNHE